MALPTIEVLIERNPLRSWARERFEIAPLRAATPVGSFGRALQLAAGSGEPSRLLLKAFDIGKLSGIDRDPATVAAARAAFPGGVPDFSVGEATALAFGDAEFDAVFDLADLHNHADWRGCLREIHRVLKPGGLLILEELHRGSFEAGLGPLFKRLTEHPYEAMFGPGDFRAAAEALGFGFLAFETRNPLGLLPQLLAVARKG